MKTFSNKTTKEHVEEIDDAEQLDTASNEAEQGNNSEFMVPVPFKMLRRISFQHRLLRNYLLNYCRNNKILGFENYGKDLPVDMHHNLNFDSRGREISKLTPEEVAENNKPIEPAYPKQYSLDELILLKEAAKAEDAKKIDK